MSVQIPFSIHIQLWVSFQRQGKVSLYPWRGQHFIWIAPARSVGRLVGSVRVRSGLPAVTIGLHLCCALVRLTMSAGNHLRLRLCVCRAISPTPLPLPPPPCCQPVWCALSHCGCSHTCAQPHADRSHHTGFQQPEGGIVSAFCPFSIHFSPLRPPRPTTRANKLSNTLVL